MPTTAELQALISAPREDLAVEHKQWLDLSGNHGKATVARAAIALANHGGGFIVIGFADQDEALVSVEPPEGLPPINQDGVNAAVRRYADPEFHVELHRATHPVSGVEHVIISVPGGQTVPVMSKRDCENVISQNRCYIRKPGPRSEDPNTPEEWRELLNRCLRAQREDMLDAIRAIVTGRVDVATAPADVEATFRAFADSARNRWQELTADLPPEAPARFPHGYYEMAFGFVGAEPAAGLRELQERLAVARQIKLTGWSTFLQMGAPGWAPYPHDEFVEAWVGRQVQGDPMSRDPSLCDFWRASREGHLYTIRGYSEDAVETHAPGTCIDVTLPVWRIGEGLLFAARLAETFEGVEQVLIQCRFTGLQGRTLTSLNRHRIMFDHSVSQTDEVTLNARATPEQLRDNLPEVLLPLLTPLYERFDFFRLPVQLVGEESQRLQQGRY